MLLQLVISSSALSSILECVISTTGDESSRNAAALPATHDEKLKTPIHVSLGLHPRYTTAANALSTNANVLVASSIEAPESVSSLPAAPVLEAESSPVGSALLVSAAVELRVAMLMVVFLIIAVPVAPALPVAPVPIAPVPKAPPAGIVVVALEAATVVVLFALLRPVGMTPPATPPAPPVGTAVGAAEPEELDEEPSDPPVTVKRPE